MIEKWKAIPSCPGFMVSNRGRVKRADGVMVKLRYEGGSWKCKLPIVDGKRRVCRVEYLVKAAFGVGCNRGQMSEDDERPCDCAMECWHCGLNPDVEYERKQEIRRGGLVKDPDGLLRYHIREDMA